MERNSDHGWLILRCKEFEDEATGPHILFIRTGGIISTPGERLGILVYNEGGFYCISSDICL